MAAIYFRNFLRQIEKHYYSKYFSNWCSYKPKTYVKYVKNFATYESKKVSLKNLKYGKFISVRFINITFVTNDTNGVNFYQYGSHSVKMGSFLGLKWRNSNNKIMSVRFINITLEKNAIKWGHFVKIGHIRRNGKNKPIFGIKMRS